MQQAEKPKGAVAEQIRKGFTSDPIIKLVDDHQQVAGPLKLRIAPPVADVDVSSKVSMKKVVGVNCKTGKPGKMIAIVFEAIITAQVPPASYTVSESGHVLQHVEVSKRFASKSNRSLSKRSVRIFRSIDPLSPSSAGRRNHSILLALRMRGP